MSSTKQFGGLPVEGSGQHEQQLAATETGSRTSESAESSGLLQKAGEAAQAEYANEVAIDFYQRV